MQNINPKLRIDGSYHFKEAFERALKTAPKAFFKSCLNCENFNEENEICKKYNQRPPARIIAYACDSYIDMEIPF